MENIFDTDFNLSNTSWKVYAGFRPVGFPLGIDVDYMDLGARLPGRSMGRPTRTRRLSRPMPWGTCRFRCRNIDVYGKAGLARWQFNGNITQPGLFNVSDNGTDFAWGAGLQYHFLDRFAARIEYEHFNIREANDVQLYSLGVSYTIL